MIKFALIMAGGAIGSLLRYLVQVWGQQLGAFLAGPGSRNDPKSWSFRTQRPVSSPTKVWSYDHDPIGNRTQSVENLGSGNKTTDYESNGVNQYPSSELSSPHTSQGYRYDDDGNLTEMFIAGDMNCDGSVNSLDTTAMNLAVSNPTQWHTLYPTCNILNGDFDGDSDVDADDQTLLADVLTGGTANATLMNYIYDAENRLIKVEPPNPGGAGIFLNTEFKYDYIGRRIEKKVWQWASCSWGSPIRHAKYVWDGWLLLEELNGLSSNAVTKKYTWGLDLAGLNGSGNDRTSAGGIGGLLAIRIVSGSKDYHYAYDGNGNVGQLIEWSNTGTCAAATKAKYEYDPYGNRVNTGSGEPANDFRFSTKMLDSETGLYHYGLRYFTPKLGGALTLGPTGDLSPRIYGFGNQLPSSISPFGLGDISEQDLAALRDYVNTCPLSPDGSGDLFLGTITVDVWDCCRNASAAIMSAGVHMLWNGFVRIDLYTNPTKALGNSELDRIARNELKEAARRLETSLGTAMRSHPLMRGSGRERSASKTNEAADKLGMQFKKWFIRQFRGTQHGF